MKIKILFQSTTDKESGEWITLPAQNNQIDKFLEEVSIKFDGDVIISKIKNNLNLDIICTDDIYYLNDGYFGLFHPYYLYLILPIIFFVAKIVATVRLE